MVLQLQRWFASVALEHVQNRMAQESSSDVVRGCMRVAWCTSDRRRSKRDMLSLKFRHGCKVAELFRSLGQLDMADTLLGSALEVLRKIEELRSALHAAVLAVAGSVKRDARQGSA